MVGSVERLAVYWRRRGVCTGVEARPCGYGSGSDSYETAGSEKGSAALETQAFAQKISLEIKLWLGMLAFSL